jgi:hypothetical protein
MHREIVRHVQQVDTVKEVLGLYQDTVHQAIIALLDLQGLIHLQEDVLLEHIKLYITQQL